MSGRHFQTPRIVQPSGRRPLLVLLLVVLVASVVGWFTFDYGQRKAGYFASRSDARTQGLEQRLEELGKECDQQRELAARYQRASQIDRMAADQVREELKTLQQQRAKLQQKVAFLQSLISGEVTVLQVSQMEVARDGEGRTYRYSFLVSKRAKSDAKVTGKVELQVVGQQEGKEITLKSDKLGLSEPLTMGFKYFQKFEGKLQLPAEFVPSELVVIGQPKGKKFKRFEQRIKWQFG